MTQLSEREFPFTARDFQWVVEELRARSGISLSGTKEDLVYNRLARRLRALHLSSFKEYRTLLVREGGSELQEFVNALTTNVTAFFREAHHFELLTRSLLPALMERNRSSRSIRIWSAGCSSGEEPYSIGMTLLEFAAQHRDWDFRVLATDLDSNMVRTAEDGVYSMEQLDKRYAELFRRWFLRGRGANEGFMRARPELRQILTFRTLNLMDPWPMKQPFDVIFCRNVTIYFDRPTQAALFSRYRENLRPRGYLIIGHSESLGGVSTGFQSIGETAYQRAHEA